MRIDKKSLGIGLGLLMAVAGHAAPGQDLRLVEAVRNQDHTAVRSLLNAHVDVNAAEGDGGTALVWAAHWDDQEAAELLIRAGADVNRANNYGVTPLGEACRIASAGMVEKLANAGANPNTPLLQTGETALMRCTRTGSVDAVKSLLAHGADVNVKEKQRGQTPLMWALEERHPEIARMLIEKGADIHAKSKGNFTPMLFAARQGDIASTKLMVERGGDVNEAAPMPRAGGKARELARGGVGNEDVAGGLPLLMVAIDSGHEPLALYLVEQGANVNAPDADGYTPLHYALRRGISILKYQALRGSPAGGYNFRANMSKLVAALLEHGANPNARTVKGTRGEVMATQNMETSQFQISLVGATPFLLAAATGDTAIMRALLAKGADPKLTTNDRTTPLMVAAGVGRHQGRDPRTKADEKQAMEAITLMLELGADINAANDSGLTAVHGAAFNGADDIIQFLVDRGAKLAVGDHLGQTPLSIAEGDPNDLVDLNEKSARSLASNSTANLIRKLGGDPLAPGPSLASEKP